MQQQQQQKWKQSTTVINCILLYICLRILVSERAPKTKNTILTTTTTAFIEFNRVRIPPEHGITRHNSWNSYIFSVKRREKKKLPCFFCVCCKTHTQTIVDCCCWGDFELRQQHAENVAINIHKHTFNDFMQF